MENLQPGIEPVNTAIRLAKFFGQNTMLLTHELGSGTTKEEIKGTHFETIVNMVESFRLTKRDFKLIEF
ncbi:MAG TPA: hypothetical protein DIW47_07155 [Bacteroidetes bacterium]|nr:hypothetical protein [Bacteroidota bacterium]